VPTFAAPQPAATAAASAISGIENFIAFSCHRRASMAKIVG
jgi:hypothetical protein